MKKFFTFLTAFLLVLSFCGPLFAEDEAPGGLSTPEVVGDLLWVRPLGFMKVALGTTAFVLSLPVTLPLRKTDEAKDFLITYVHYYYFKRPLREM
jgi:hypothetical protein